MNHPDRTLLIVGALLMLATLMLAYGCKTSYEAESASHATVADTLEQQGHVIEERTSTAPIRIVTETTTATGARRVRTVDLAPVAKSTVTSDLKSQERQDSTLSSESKTETKRDFLHSPFTWIGAIVVLAGIGGAVWKLRKVVPV